jgi:hypothetical protein
MKFKFLFAFCCLFIFGKPLVAQNQSDCNKLGAWLWYIDITGFQNHGQIADTLKALGIKRIYVKVADGTPNTNIWPELIDASLPATYKARGLEVWAWSYNYTSNPAAQSNALYMAAQTGYQGFVVDVETEFDGLTTPLSNLFNQFAQKKADAIQDGFADSTFQLYCTTWGNPMDHNFHIELIDPHVDGFMPQTYVEQWGPSYVQNLEYWIQVGNDEYVALGATKPIHHIAALEDGGMTPSQLDAFIQASGPQSSLWRIPGGSVATSLWNTWNAVDWRANFCVSGASNLVFGQQKIHVWPNPVADYLVFDPGQEIGTMRVLDASGKIWIENTITQAHEMPCTQLPAGLYFLHWQSKNGIKSGRFIKQ